MSKEKRSRFGRDKRDLILEKIEAIAFLKILQGITVIIVP
jgi:hypothetical protein